MGWQSEQVFQKASGHRQCLGVGRTSRSRASLHSGGPPGDKAYRKPPQRKDKARSLHSGGPPGDKANRNPLRKDRARSLHSGGPPGDKANRNPVRKDRARRG